MRWTLLNIYGRFFCFGWVGFPHILHSKNEVEAFWVQLLLAAACFATIQVRVLFPFGRAIAEYLSRDLLYKISCDDVYVTSGCTQAIDVAMTTTLARLGGNI